MAGDSHEKALNRRLKGTLGFAFPNPADVLPSALGQGPDSSIGWPGQPALAAAQTGPTHPAQKEFHVPAQTDL
ncbi:MAG: hypothetical protein AAFW83_07200 [Pseudomonadota bacterium]